MKAKKESLKAGLKLSTQKNKRSWHPVSSLHSKLMGKQWKQWETLYFGAPKSLQMVTEAMKLKGICSLEESYDQPEQHIKSRDTTLPTKVHLVKAMFFPVVMYGCEGWTIKEGKHRKNWCFLTVVSEKTLESPLDCKQIQWVHHKANQSWIFIGKPDAEAPILWPPDAKKLIHWKRPWC